MKNEKTIGQKKILAVTMPKSAQFWKKELENVIPSIFLTDFRKSNNNDYNANYYSSSVKINSELCKKLLEAFNIESTEISDVFSMSIISLLFISYNGINQDFLVNYNSTISSNHIKMPLRVQFNKEDTALVIFEKIRNYVYIAREHQKYPVELLISNKNIGINVTSLLEYKNNYFNQDNALTFDFILEDDESFTLKVTGDTSYYLVDSIKDIANRIKLILECCANSPKSILLNIDLVSENDEYIYNSLNSTENPYSDTVSLVDLFKNTFSKYAEEYAVISKENNVKFSELESMSKQVASFITEVSDDSDSVIGILCDRSIDFLVGVFGILLSRKAYLPLDPKAPEERNETILKQSTSKIVIYADKYKDKLPSDIKGYTISEIKASNFNYSDIKVNPNSLAYVIFTSGSTGLPKGVCVNHRSAINRIEWMQRSFTLSNDDVILHKTPSTFDVSVWELFWWAIIGCKVTLLPANQEANPEAIIEAIEKNSVTAMHFVPSMLNAFLDYVKSTSAMSRIKSLKRVFCSGEALSSNHVQKFYELFNNAELINLYGPTEATVDVTYHITKNGENPIPIGKPIDNTRLYIVNSLYNKCPIGMVGELCIAGVGVSEGYINDKTRTSERFVSMPSLNEEIVYLTGDLARIRHDKTIEYLGRNDRQVKVRGFRIELGEIESALTKQRYISDAIVITNVELDNISHLFAYVILNDKTISSDKIIADISKVLPKYMIPDKIIILDVMPLTPNGKVDKSALVRLNENRKNEERILPSSQEEKIIAQIWRDVLGVNEVGINDNFFQLGGNSINFVSVLALANEKGLKFTFQQLFKHPTISDLLNSSDEADEDDDLLHEISNFELISEEDRKKIPYEIEDAYPMSMLQSGLVYQSTIMEGTNNYHDIVSYLIKGNIDVKKFSKAVEKLVETQPIFRTSYNLSDYSEYLQIVHRKVDKLPLNVYDLRGLKTDEEKEKMYEQWFWKEQHRPFNWETPGLVQLHIHILSDDLYKYSISQHNSALDGWSMNKVHTFLFETYFELVNGTNTFDRTLGSNNHNKTFIYLEQKAIKSPKFNKFWSKTVENAPNGIIPCSRIIDKKKGNEVIFHDIELPKGLSEKLITLANELKVPVKDILLASHIKFISLLTQNNDVFMGYEIGGRPELLGAEEALGVFLNTMPFRVIIDKKSSWKDLIRNVYDTEAKLLPYRRYPMAKVKQDMGNMGILFETVFNFTHFYSLKKLRNLPGFDMIDVRAAAITEFPLRVEYSRHFYTDKVELSLHYHTAQYDEDDIRIFGEIFVDILESMVCKTNESHESMSISNHLKRFKIYNINNTDKNIDNNKNKEFVVEDKLNQPKFIEAVERVKNIWSNVLKIPKDKINLKDDFFLIGGSSLTAMKVALFLQKQVSLKTIMQKSMLFELAEEIMNGKSNLEKNTNILQCLSKSTSASLNIIFLPYAGGNAMNFMPIAKEFENCNLNISIFAAELPGHDPNVQESKFVDFSQLSKMLVDEIEVKMKGKEYIIWGHCVGTSLALEITNQLEKKGIAPKKLYLAAKTINNPNEFLVKIENAKNLKFSDIAELHAEWSGSNELSRLGEAYEQKLVEAFKHDADESNKYLYSLWSKIGKVVVQTPTTVVVTKDDPATENYKEDWKVWKQWAPNINLKEFNKGGHYFLCTIQSEVAEYMLAENEIK